MDRISKNITYNEAIFSNTAKRKGIENKPNDEHISAMMSIADMVFKKLCWWSNKNNFFLQVS